MKTRTITMIVCLVNHTWYHDDVEIPINTPEENINEVAINIFFDKMYKNPYKSMVGVSYIDVYSTNDDLLEI